MFPNQPLEPTAVRIAREFREAVNAQLDAQMYELGQRWLQVEYALQDKIDALILEIQDMVKDGKEPSKGMITRLKRYQELRNQTHAELMRYENYIEGAIKTGQYNMAVEGLNVGKETIFALYQDAGMLGNFNILNANAIETMVGYLGNGAPLNTLLQEAFPYAWKGMTDKLVEGIALGLSPRETANKMYKGMSQGFNRLLTISRTEQLRAYRQATVMQYRESGVVKGFRRLVAKQGACMACFVDYKTPILTSKGYKKIIDVKVGDLVLTHKGRYRPVSKLLRQHVDSAEIVTIRIKIPGGKGLDTLTMTDNHPVLTRRGWVEAKDIRSDDLVAVPTQPCQVCGKPILFNYRGNKVCSKSCTGKLGASGLHNNKEAHDKAIKNMKKTHMEMWKKGIHPFQDSEIRKRATRNALRANSLLVSSRTEGKLSKAFSEIGLNPETQYPIFSRYQKKQNRTYYYYADFAFPKEKLIVEADGEPWHSWDEKRLKRDQERQEKIESQGWSVLRYRGSEIENDALSIAKEVKSVLQNHSGQYGIEFVQIKSIEHGVRKPPSPQFKVTRYNFEVEEDHSYVAKYAVVHNCLVSDGEYFEVAEDFSDHPNGKCALICVLNGVPEREWLYGENWFRSLGADQQQSIMGDQYYQAWQGGAFKLSELRSTAHSDVWGDSPKVTPLKELVN